MRIGNGYDVHRLVVGRPLILGGVRIPSEFGLEGHSDGDALCHAIADALLGAAGLGDIGMWFPPEDPSYKNADSVELLKRVSDELNERRYSICNIDTVVICERPKLSPFFAQIRRRLAAALEIAETQISVKASTNEGLGFIGRGEAIAVEAVTLID